MCVRVGGERREEGKRGGGGLEGRERGEEG